MEALNDPYRDTIARGGKPHHASFWKVIMTGFAGPGYVEDMPGMLVTHTLYDDYWAAKYINTANIDVPLYLTASYSSGLHIAGSFKTFETAKTKEKWLRVHPYQEWYDLYRPEIVDELQRYFDRYCKGIDNGWEREMPPVRLSLLAFDKSPAKTIRERPEDSYPLARQRLVKYYLSASDHTLLRELPSASSSASHEAHSLTASSDFILHFKEYTELAGYPKVILWMSCAEKDDIDVAVNIRKIDSSGELLEHLNYPCPVPVHEVANTNVAKTLGPEGFLRASHAISRDHTRTSDDGQQIFYTHDHRRPVVPGEVVRLEITLWPIGMIFEKGEGLMLRISGHEMIYPEFEAISPKEPEDENLGRHVIYTGGQHASALIVPMI